MQSTLTEVRPGNILAGSSDAAGSVLHRTHYPRFIWPGAIPVDSPSGADRELAPRPQTEEPKMVSFEVSREIPADDSKVWGLIGEFDTMCWHPGILTGSVSRQDGKATRSLIANGGAPTFEEELLELGGRFLRYKMTGGVPITPIFSHLLVECVSANVSRVTWSASFDPTGVDPQLVSPVKLGVTAFYEAGLTAIAQVYDTDKHE